MFYTLSNLKTPCLIVSKQRMGNNISRISEYGKIHNIKIRPHIKTHKSVFVGELQQDAGATGISVANLGEATVFSEKGFSSIFITRSIAEENKFDSLFKLSRNSQIIVAVDNLETAQKLGSYYSQRNKQLSVRLEIDCGQHRCGVLPENALPLAKKIWKIEGISFDGIFTHAGQVYGASPDKKEKIAKVEAQALIEVYHQLTKAGIPCQTRSTGTTPTFPYTHNFPEINEIRPGIYVFYDRMQMALETCKEEDLALKIMATVISRPAPDRCIINAGSKALGLDMGVHGKQMLEGYGKIDGHEAIIKALSEEHGIVEIAKESALKPGSNIMITPNHACSVINLYDYFWLMNDNYVERQITIDARGKNW